MPSVSSPDLKVEAGRFKAAFDELLRDYLSETTKRYHTTVDHPTINTLFLHLLKVAEGGKRLRPFVVFALYKEQYPTAALADLRELLLAVELFHIFCLIHDDVMDEAPLRHGVPTLHHFTRSTMYQEVSRDEAAVRASESQAILVGDMVFNLVSQLLFAAAARGLPYSPAISTIFHTLVEEVCLGQMLDIDLTVAEHVSEELVRKKNEFKTARYSFVRPLHIGATLAGREATIPALTRFGLALGQLYQIQDDLLDVLGNEQETQKPTFQDVEQGQHTLLTAFVRERGGKAAALLDAHSGNPLTPQQKAELLEMFLESGAIAYAQTCITSLADNAQKALTDPLLSQGEVALLFGLLELVHHRTT